MFALLRAARPRSLARRCIHTESKTITVLGKTYPTDAHTNITQSVLSKLSAELHNQPGHPICTLKTLIQNHFHDFTHISSLSPLVSPEKNFDELGFPADHSGRAVSDTYYINKDLLLRTHTSAHEVETFARGEDKWLLTADVYRRDEIDASHYPVFHQMEGARVFDASDPKSMEDLKADNARLEDVLARSNILIEDVPHISPENPVQAGHDPVHSELVAINLKLSLNSMLFTLFGGRDGEPLRVRWIEAYFPFTSPSYEVEVLYQGKWLEILGSGVIQQLTLNNANVPQKMGWAFGLGIERIAMILFGIPDIRLFWSTDPRFLSQFSGGIQEFAHGARNLTTFKPYSKYPACPKDVSFWMPENVLMHDNDFCDLVRDVVGDLAEDVKMIDTFSHPKTKRTSFCYRVNYRSMDRSLSNAETNDMHASLIDTLVERYNVEIR